MLGTIQVVYGGGAPEWLDAALNAYAYVGAAFGFTAAANVLNGKGQAGVAEAELPAIESDYETVDAQTLDADTVVVAGETQGLQPDEDLEADEQPEEAVAGEAPYEARHSI